MRSVVVLPEPLGPRKPVIRPCSTWIEKSFTTRRPPNDLLSPSASIATRHRIGSTSTGRPGTSAAPLAGRASTMNTSRSRASRL